MFLITRVYGNHYTTQSKSGVRFFYGDHDQLELMHPTSGTSYTNAMNLPGTCGLVF